MKFQSPTFGEIDDKELKHRIEKFMKEKKEARYRIIVGSDSQKVKKDVYDFVVAIIVHRVGSGGIYFWQRRLIAEKISLKERMYQEAIFSLESAEKIFELLKENGISKYNIEIHVDIGRQGQTREMISEIIGMVRANGYEVKIKPESFGASKVADRHT